MEAATAVAAAAFDAVARAADVPGVVPDKQAAAEWRTLFEQEAARPSAGILALRALRAARRAIVAAAARRAAEHVDEAARKALWPASDLI